MVKILLVDDDLDLLHVMTMGLKNHGLTVVTASSRQEAIEKFTSEDIDLCILDIMMEEQDDGFVLLNQLKQMRDVPILFLTSRNSLSDCLYGFEIGADDYIYKPFSMDELIARVNARIKNIIELEKQYRIGDFIIDIENQSVSYRNQTIIFTNHEIKLIHFLARHSGEVFNEEELYRYIWKSHITLNTRTCSVHIANIRKKMKEIWGDPFIHTCWGEGYMFVIPK